MPRRRTSRTFDDVMHVHPEFHMELARQRQQDLIAQAQPARVRTSRRRRWFGRLRTASERAPWRPITPEEACDAAVRHFAS
jgi:hypothetical protein